MRFLETNEIEEWCANNSISLKNGDRVYPEANPSLSYTSVCYFTESGQSNREPIVSASCVQALGEWDEALLWITQWGVWTSSEDWPTYYRLRGSYEERRSLETAPGHLFAVEEKAILIEFLAIVMENGWDAFIFPKSLAKPDEIRAFISHDGRIDLYSLSPIKVDDFTYGQPNSTLHPTPRAYYLYPSFLGKGRDLSRG
jgi:hypothetical protein